MKLQLLSDLHLEFFPGATNLHPEEFVQCIVPFLSAADVLVLAGDICPARHVPYLATLVSKHYKHTVYVPGNHEYYGCTPDEANADISKANSDTFHVLNGGIYSIGGMRFVGTSLWFSDNRPEYKHALSDFKMIHSFEPWVYEENKRACKLLYEHVVAPADDIVVVTHHVPTTFSEPEQYKNSPLNRYFVHDLLDIIMDSQPKLWVHGHTHFSFDYNIGATRVVCNPFGYYGFEVNNGFVKNLIVEV